MIYRRRLPQIVLLLLATFLRLYRLDFRALWWDEGLSLLFARLDFVSNAQMAVKLADTNPPLYRLLLGAWLDAVGWSAFTARLFSALPGVILVAVVYRLTRDLKLPRQVALTAMALCTASPMLIYYSQEAKGYSLVAMSATAWVLLLFRLLPHSHTPKHKYGGVGVWGLWGVSLLLAIGSHYIAAFLIAVENLWLVILTASNGFLNGKTDASATVSAFPFPTRWKLAVEHSARLWAPLIGAQLLVAAFLLPFILLTYGGTGAAVRGETGEFRGLNGPLEFFSQHAIELTQGPEASGVWAGVVAAAVLFLAVIGIALRVIPSEARNLNSDTERFLAAKSAARNDISNGILLSWNIAPIALGFALNSYHQFFFPRFVLYTVPPLMILVANGIWRIADSLWRIADSKFQLANIESLITRFGIWILGFGLWVLGFGIFWTPTLLTHYTTPSDPAEDWRPVAGAMRPLMQAGDAAIYGWGWMPGYLDAYLPRAPRPSYTLGFFTPESLDADMSAIILGKSRVWLLDYQIDQLDARNMAGRWLAARSALVYDQWIGRAHIALFALTPTPTDSTNQITFEFANGLRLTAPEVQAALSPGDALTVALKWEATRPITTRVTIFLHGQAADGALIFGRDSEPDNGFSLVTAWKVGEPHAELRGAIIPLDAPPGKYGLSVGMYDTAIGEVIEGSPVMIGVLTVK